MRRRPYITNTGLFMIMLMCIAFGVILSYMVH